MADEVVKPEIDLGALSMEEYIEARQAGYGDSNGVMHISSKE